jgi:hypothetical protein
MSKGKIGVVYDHTIEHVKIGDKPREVVRNCRYFHSDKSVQDINDFINRFDKWKKFVEIKYE